MSFRKTRWFFSMFPIGWRLLKSTYKQDLDTAHKDFEADLKRVADKYDVRYHKFND